MSAALADAVWAQIMIQDILDQTVTVRNTTGGTLPFQVVLRSNCTLSKRLPHDHSIDAKSVFDALIKECAGNRQDRRQDRRTAVDLAIVRETLKAQGSHIRWIPHPLMLADSMTKADPFAGNDALRHFLRTGKLVWDEETIRQSARLGRTKAVSRRQLDTNDETLYGTCALSLLYSSRDSRSLAVSVMKNCGSTEERLFLFFFGFGASSLRMASSVPFCILIVRRYEVEEDGGSLQFWSIWQQVQIDRKANMVLLSRVFQ